MANLPTKSFLTLVSEQVAAIQGGSAQLLDFSVGTILRAVVEAYSAVALWLQGMILTLLATTRAATSTGSDLDTWMADYGLTRLPPMSASGLVIFSRFTATNRAVVPIGAIVQTADGKSAYAVVIDMLNAAYSSTDSGYVIAAGISSVDITVVASASGSAANAVAAAVTSLATAIPGVDTISNAAAFTNGADPETDAALRLRFVAYIASLSKATKVAVAYAIASVETDLQFVLVENATLAGTYQPGYFYVILSQAGGLPSSPIIAAVYAAIDAIRPVTVTFAVFAPTALPVSVSMVITTSASFSHSTLVTQVQAAVAAYLAALPIGAPLPYTRIAQIAYDVSPGVTNATSVIANGGTADITPTATQLITPGTVTIT
jgi:uncharacterized phage protein gp47/JayE